MLVNDSNFSYCGRGFDSLRLHHLKKGCKMYLEPIAAMSIAIFLSVTMFFAMYLTAYTIVSGALFTTKKIKLKIHEYRKEEEDNL